MKELKELTLYIDVGTKVSKGSLRVITPPTPSSFNFGTSLGNGTAPNNKNCSNKTNQIKTIILSRFKKCPTFNFYHINIKAIKNSYLGCKFSNKTLKLFNIDNPHFHLNHNFSNIFITIKHNPSILIKL